MVSYRMRMLYEPTELLFEFAVCYYYWAYIYELTPAGPMRQAFLLAACTNCCKAMDATVTNTNDADPYCMVIQKK